MSRPIQEPTPAREVGSNSYRIKHLESRPIPESRWVYVGTYPGDPNTTFDSPPFENGFTNADAVNFPVRFRRKLLGCSEIEGKFTGGGE